MTTTEHEMAVFEEEDGWQFILIWIDQDDVEAFADVYTEDEWQQSIEDHPFIAERNLPVVIAFDSDDGPRLYGDEEYVDAIADDFDWDSIIWGHKLTLSWEDDDEEYDDEEYDD